MPLLQLSISIACTTGAKYELKQVKPILSPHRMLSYHTIQGISHPRTRCHYPSKNVFRWATGIFAVLAPSWSFCTVLTVHWWTFENLPICLCSYKNITLKMAHPKFSEFSSYLPVRFINFLKSRLIFNIFYCFWMLVNKLLTCKVCVNLKSSTLFSHEDEGIGRSSNLH